MGCYCLVFGKIIKPEKALFKYNKIKIVLVIALWMACLFDLGTFLLLNSSQFEANPLFLLTKSIFPLIAVKLLFCAGCTYLLLKYKRKKTFVYAYALVLLALYAFLGQSFGGYLNLNTHWAYEETKGTPQEIQPLEQNDAISAYLKLMALVIYVPMFIAIIAFLLFERIYLKGFYNETRQKI